LGDIGFVSYRRMTLHAGQSRNHELHTLSVLSSTTDEYAVLGRTHAKEQRANDKNRLAASCSARPASLVRTSNCTTARGSPHCKEAGLRVGNNAQRHCNSHPCYWYLPDAAVIIRALQNGIRLHNLLLCAADFVSRGARLEKASLASFTWDGVGVFAAR
jgi:hypothetical protein